MITEHIDDLDARIAELQTRIQFRCLRLYRVMLWRTASSAS